MERVTSEKILGNGQVAGAGNGQKFCNTLDKSQEQSVQQGHGEASLYNISSYDSTTVCDFPYFFAEFLQMIGDAVHGGSSQKKIPSARRLILLIVAGTLPLFLILPIKAVNGVADHLEKFQYHFFDVRPIGGKYRCQSAQMEQHVKEYVVPTELLAHIWSG